MRVIYKIYSNHQMIFKKSNVAIFMSLQPAFTTAICGWL